MNFSPDAMKAKTEQACALMKAQANPYRLLIVCALVEGETSVGALAQTLGARESLASQHLGLLRGDGILSARQDGQSIYYALQSGPARALIETPADQFCNPPEPS
ncbi:MAG TPA: metalloregulator ArsR/SmtB family transcription factor [Phenylobacterium sp.]